MHVNVGMSHLSTAFFVVALACYALSVLAFAADFAYGRRRGTEQAGSRSSAARVPELAVAGVAGDGAVSGGPAFGGGPSVADSAAAGGTVAEPVSVFAAIRGAGVWVQVGLLLTVVGVSAHLLGVVFRGLAIDRVPLSDMYEYVTALTLVAVVSFLVVMVRYRAWYLGLFVNGAVVVALGLTETLVYTTAGQVVPALQSFWLSVHVTSVTLATGVYFVAAVMGVVYLAQQRHVSRVAAGRIGATQGIMGRLPVPEVIDRLAYRTVVFAFPLWTFGVITGAIWADRAWGSYWSWDPVETWAFITWVLYAGFLHARATAGWRGKKATYIQLAAFACLLINVLVVQVFITGLHSYAGLN